LDEHKIINHKEDKKRSSELIEQINKNWNDIIKAGRVIVEGVELPAIGEDVSKELQN
jgi:hypothetical protein